MSATRTVSTSFVSPDPARQRFDDRTHALVEMFGAEPLGIQNVALLASDFLLEVYGPAARWRDLDIDALIARLTGPAALFGRMVRELRGPLTEFAALAESQEGIALAATAGDGMITTPTPRSWVEGAEPIDLSQHLRAEALPNRAERRSMARDARRSRRR